MPAESWRHTCIPTQNPTIKMETHCFQASKEISFESLTNQWANKEESSVPHMTKKTSSGLDVH